MKLQINRRFGWLLLLAAGLALAGTAFAVANNATAPPRLTLEQQTQRTALLSTDLSSVLPAIKTIDPTTEEGKRLNPVGSYALTKRVLSSSDLAVAGFRRLPSGQITTFNDTVNEVMVYYHHFGVLPKSGVDLFPELMTTSGFAAFQRLSTADKYEKYHAGINPLTGRFLNGFDDPAWRAGEFYFQPQTKSAKTKTGDISSIFRGKDAVACQYSEFGDDQGEVLVAQLAAANSNPPADFPK